MKITISWGRNDTFDTKVNFIRGFFWWVNEYIFGFWVGFPSSPGFSMNV